MAGKVDYKKMSTKKKSRKLFFGMLGPLLTITIVSCTFFYNVSNKIIDYYLNAELRASVEKLNSKVLEKMNPITVNIEDFTNFASLSDDREVLGALTTVLGKDLRKED